MAYSCRTTINRRIAIARAKRIPADTADLRAAIKREIWTRGFTLGDVARRVRITAPALRVRLGAGWRSKRGLSPRLVDSIASTNRLVVLLNWFWAYWSYQRGARIILGRDAAPPD